MSKCIVTKGIEKKKRKRKKKKKGACHACRRQAFVFLKISIAYYILHSDTVFRLTSKSKKDVCLDMNAVCFY